MSQAKTPEAAEREKVYQEGRRAFFARTANVYYPGSWRAKTWQKGYDCAAADMHEVVREQKTRTPLNTRPDTFETWWEVHSHEYNTPEEAARAAWEAKS